MVLAFRPPGQGFKLEGCLGFVGAKGLWGAQGLGLGWLVGTVVVVQGF